MFLEGGGVASGLLIYANMLYLPPNLAGFNA